MKILKIKISFRKLRNEISSRMSESIRPVTPTIILPSVRNPPQASSGPANSDVTALVAKIAIKAIRKSVVRVSPPKETEKNNHVEKRARDEEKESERERLIQSNEKQEKAKKQQKKDDKLIDLKYHASLRGAIATISPKAVLPMPNVSSLSVSSSSASLPVNKRRSEIDPGYASPTGYMSPEEHSLFYPNKHTKENRFVGEMSKDEIANSRLVYDLIVNCPDQEALIIRLLNNPIREALRKLYIKESNPDSNKSEDNKPKQRVMKRKTMYLNLGFGEQVPTANVSDFEVLGLSQRYTFRAKADRKCDNDLWIAVIDKEYNSNDESEWLTRFTITKTRDAESWNKGSPGKSAPEMARDEKTKQMEEEGFKINLESSEEKHQVEKESQSEKEPHRKFVKDHQEKNRVKEVQDKVKTLRDEVKIVRRAANTKESNGKDPEEKGTSTMIDLVTDSSSDVASSAEGNVLDVVEDVPDVSTPSIVTKTDVEREAVLIAIKSGSSDSLREELAARWLPIYKAECEARFMTHIDLLTSMVGKFREQEKEHQIKDKNQQEKDRLQQEKDRVQQEKELQWEEKDKRWQDQILALETDKHLLEKCLIEEKGHRDASDKRYVHNSQTLSDLEKQYQDVEEARRVMQQKLDVYENKLSNVDKNEEKLKAMLEFQKDQLKALHNERNREKGKWEKIVEQHVSRIEKLKAELSQIKQEAKEKAESDQRVNIVLDQIQQREIENPLLKEVKANGEVSQFEKNQIVDDVNSLIKFTI